jgi:adenylate cyclase
MRCPRATTPMSDAIASWLLDPTTSALETPALLDGLAQRLAAADLDLHRMSIWIPTKHPELWGHQLMWTPQGGPVVTRRSHAVSLSDDYVGTPAEALHNGGTATLRVRLDRDPDRGRFAMLAKMADAGATDYLLTSAEPRRRHGSWVSYATRRAGGFDDAQLALLERLTPVLALHIQLLAAHFATQSLLEVYLGRNAARRVIDGEFRRGTGTEIDAALWFCDMRGFTAMSDRMPARAVVGVLDRYFEHVATPIEEHGGEILKFIGDATLAVFPIGEATADDACRRALAAAQAVLARIDAWSSSEAGEIRLGIALHTGRVFYGNIGGRDRLDFTVIGGSVNEVCRVEAMCKTLGEPLLMTSAFVTALGDAKDVVSLGDHALKGVAQSQEILTVRR